MNPLEKFGLPKTASPEDVKDRWQKIAMEHHPDHGGDGDVFQKQFALYKAALAEAQKPAKCGKCNGTKKVKITKGFYTVTLPCPLCTKNKIK